MAPSWAVELDKRLFSVCVGKKAPDLMVHIPHEVKLKEYLLKDIKKFRAAAIAFDQAHHIFKVGPKLRIGNEDILDCFPEAGYNGEALSYEQILDQLDRDWKRCFSPGFTTYTSLNKTLANLPGRLPPRLLWQLKYVKLQRPIFRRSELISAILGSLDNDHAFDGMYAAFAGLNSKVFQFATHEQIRKGLALIPPINGVHALPIVSPTTNYKMIVHLVNYLSDYNEVHRGNLVGLARKSIDYHRNIVLATCKHPPETKVKKPPIEPPKKVKFLETVGDIQQESVDMGHCIGGYASGAVEGRHYLFHIEYKGELASAQVSFLGKVLQCRGPKNQQNQAVRWAENYLNTWGRKLRDKADA